MFAIKDILLSNLGMIGTLMAVLCIAFMSNTVLGMAKGAATHEFEWPICWNGLKKGIFILLGIFMVTTVVSMIPPIFSLYDITIISEIALESISLVCVVSPIVGATVLYTKDAIIKITDLLKIKSSEDVDE